MPVLKYFILSMFLAITTLASQAHAGKEFNIFDVRKSLGLSDDEPVYHDFYINMGTEDGVKVGNKLLVYRKVPVLDIYRNKAQADLIAPVAQIIVIHAQASLSIARMVKVIDPRKAPVLQWGSVMVGDRVEFISNDSTGQDEKESSEESASAKADQKTKSEQAEEQAQNEALKTAELRAQKEFPNSL